MKRKRPVRWLKILAAFGTAALVSLLFWQLPYFRLQDIHVQPLRALDEAQVIAASQIEDRQHLLRDLGGSGKHWLDFRYRDVEKRLQDAFPQIETVTVTLDFPAAVQIEIKERIEVAYLAIPDGHVILDKHGVALWTQSQRPQEIPVIEGIRALSMDLGSPLTVDVPEAMNSAITLMGAIIEADKDARADRLLLPQVESIRPIGGRQVYLQIRLPGHGDKTLTVLATAGHEPLDNMTWLRFALEQGVLEDRGRGILDMTGDRITFRPD